jgi:hypothetical protein
MAFQVVVKCHQLSRQPKSGLLVSGAADSLQFLKYASHDSICSDLRGVFGNVRLVDGAVAAYTDPATTGDHTRNVFAIPDNVSTLSINDIAHSILEAHQRQVWLRQCQAAKRTLLTS